MRLNGVRGQSTLEYAVLMAAVISALLAMQIVSKRAVSGRLRASTDQIGPQWDPANATYRVKISSVSERKEETTTSGAVTSTIQGTGDVQERVAEVDEKINKPTSDKLF